MTKKRKKLSVFFSKKIGVTPLVAAPGDTSPSDAIAAGVNMACSSHVTSTANQRRVTSWHNSS